MKSSKQGDSTDKKEMAFSEFSTGKYTQREVAHKYNISEWGLSKYISERIATANSSKR